MASMSTARNCINIEAGLDSSTLAKAKGKTIEEPKISSYEETAVIWESLRLPTYRSRSLRYSPYGRFAPSESNKPPYPVDRFFNTAYDDKCVFLDVPPAVAPQIYTSHVSPKAFSIQEGPSNHQDFENVFQQLVMDAVPAAPTPEEAIAWVNHEHEVDAQDLAYALEDVQALDRQMQATAAIIFREFVAGLTRARQE